MIGVDLIISSRPDSSLFSAEDWNAQFSRWEGGSVNRRELRGRGVEAGLQSLDLTEPTIQTRFLVRASSVR